MSKRLLQLEQETEAEDQEFLGLLLDEDAAGEENPMISAALENLDEKIEETETPKKKPFDFSSLMPKTSIKKRKVNTGLLRENERAAYQNLGDIKYGPETQGPMNPFKVPDAEFAEVWDNDPLQLYARKIGDEDVSVAGYANQIRREVGGDYTEAAQRAGTLSTRRINNYDSAASAYQYLAPAYFPWGIATQLEFSPASDELVPSGERTR